MSIGGRLLGEPQFHPIFAAAADHDLAVTLHLTGTEGIFLNGPTLGGGPPTFNFDYRATFSQPYQSNLVSLIAHGTFERFPTLRVVFAEVGFAWLAEMMWRLDSEWKANRDEIPWVKRPPSEYILDHCWFTSQPFIEPEKPAYVANILEMMHADRTLLFSTDYPHWDFDDPNQVMMLIPAELKHRICVDNPLAAYGSRLM